MPEGVNVLGRAVDTASGETVAEFFGPPNAFSNEGDAITRCLYYLSEVIIRGIQPDRRGGFLGGEFGYGADYENDVFFMHPDYQDAECDCGRRKKADAWHKRNRCKASCYWRIAHAVSDKAGKPYRAIMDWLIYERNALPWMSKESDVWQRQVEQFSKQERRAKQEALKVASGKAGRKWQERGSMADCTCGQERRNREWYDAHPHAERCAIMLPHFWHKPSGLKITWYKWIGRDMKMEPPSISGQQWGELFHECLDSLPPDAVVKAKLEAENERIERDKPEYEEAQVAGMAAMMEIMSDPEKHGAPPEKRACGTCGKKEEGPPSWTTPLFWECGGCREKRGATLKRKAMKAARELGIELVAQKVG